MIVVTTPTGAIGHQLLDMLMLQSGGPLRIIARDAGKLPAAVRNRVDVVEGSHGDADVVDKALDGAESLFWVKPPDFRTPDYRSSYVDFGRPACRAIKTHGVKRVVAVSALGRGLPVAAKAGLVTATLEADDLIMATGADFRALTMPSFMDNTLRQVVPIRDMGVFFGPIDADLKVPFAATRDIASTAARLLLDGGWSGQGDQPVLGPEDLSFNEVAQIMSDVLGRPVRYQQVSLEDHAASLRRTGASESMIEGLIDMAHAKNQGLDNAVKRTAQTATPTSFRQFCEEVLKPALFAAA